MLSGISVVCFASSYGVAVLLEFSRFFVRTGVRNAVMVAFAAAGLFAHTVYLIFLLRQRWELGMPAATWYSGCLILAWALAATYLLTVFGRQKPTSGLLLLPTSLALIAAAHLFPQATGSVRFWALVHGMSLAVGTALVVVGFLAGVMYLVQSYRMKRKLPPRSSFWLPSLEWLQWLNERALYWSIGLVGLGLITGILLNLIRGGREAPIPWSDPVVIASLAWLAWLVSIAIFNALYRPARHGRKVAYETVTGFLFLSVVLGLIRSQPDGHGAERAADTAASVLHRADADPRLPPAEIESP